MDNFQIVFAFAFLLLIIFLMFFIPLWIVRKIRQLKEAVQDKYDKEMELMQAQLDYYKNKSSENDI